MSEYKREYLRSVSPIHGRTGNTRFLFVTGGVVSGLGKGITISSIGRLLKASGLRVTSIKIDPYLNSDAGTMSPFEHGETFVLNDGGETDLDLGNYERFLDIELTKDHNITTGKVYSAVIERERRGDYLGKTVQVVPHVTEEIQNWIARVGQICVDGSGHEPDICLVEVGGTVGDIESMVFLEAIRQFQYRIGRDRCCLVHVSLVPALGSLGEQKTKPTQHGVKELMSLGLNPDIIVCRSTQALEESTRCKISSFCHVPPHCVISVHDVSNIYHVPLILEAQDLHTIVFDIFGLKNVPHPQLQMQGWRELAYAVDNANEDIVICIVGKYTGLHDAYLSVIKALKHATMKLNRKLFISWVESSMLEKSTEVADPEKYNEAWRKLRSAEGILIPGGFGVRGTEGMEVAAKFARTEKVPILGICLGLQVMVIEYARNCLGWEKANSAEYDELAELPVIVKMLEHHTGAMGGTMRLGARETDLYPLPDADMQVSSIASLIYEGASFVMERHRHRYEVNPDLVGKLEAGGLRFTGKDTSKERMEIVELPFKSHPFYFATQFHPELKSHPERPSPPFLGFVLASTNAFSQHFRMPEPPSPRRMRGVTEESDVSPANEFSPLSSAPGVLSIAPPAVDKDHKAAGSQLT